MEGPHRDRFGASLYSSLDDDSQEIRLLNLIPSVDSTDHRIELSTHSMATSPGYIALSYMWGDPNVTEEITVSGIKVHVTSNLALALKGFLSRLASSHDTDGELLDLPKYLWADAICINQNNLEEKGKQVRMMGRIYERADLVISWLWRPDKEISNALVAIRLFADQIKRHSRGARDMEWLRESPVLWQLDASTPGIPNKVWNALDAFTSHPFWSRIWTIQEMVLAKKLFVMNQDELVSFRDVETVAQWSHATIHNPRFKRPDFFPMKLWGHILLSAGLTWFYISNITILRKYLMFGHLGKIFPQSIQRQFFEPGIYRATDPRDKIIALLSIVKFDLTPDYTKTTRQIYCAFAKEWRVSKNDIDTVLCYSGIGLGTHDTFGLPSWVPDFSSISHRSMRISVLFHQADSNLRASDVPADFVNEQDTLKIYGMATDTVEFVHGPLSYEDILRFCSEYVMHNTGTKYKTGIPRLQAVFRLFSEGFLDEASGLKSAVVDLLRVLVALVKTRDIEILTWMTTLYLFPERNFADWYHTHVDPDNVPVSSSATEVHQAQTISDILTVPTSSSARLLRQSTTLISILANSRIFCTSSGLLGLGCVGVQAGDEVAVLKGCSYPVLLRKGQTEDAEEDGDTYQHVGVCYVLGLMAGEVAEAPGDEEDSKGLKMQQFSIV